MWERKTKYDLDDVVAFCQRYIKPGVVFKLRPEEDIGDGNTKPGGQKKGSWVGILPRLSLRQTRNGMVYR